MINFHVDSMRKSQLEKDEKAGKREYMEEMSSHYMMGEKPSILAK